MMPLVGGGYPVKNPNNLINGGLVLAETFPRFHLTNDESAALTTQVMLSAAIVLQAGQIVTSIGFLSGATAASVPTNWWVALYSTAATPAKLAQSADQTTTAIGANAAFELALATPQLISTSGVYYAALMVKATTVPSIQCKTLPLASGSTGRTGQSVLVQTSGSALVATAPATIATPTATAKIPYLYVV